LYDEKIQTEALRDEGAGPGDACPAYRMDYPDSDVRLPIRFQSPSFSARKIMENLMQVLDRAKARHEEHERAINASATLRDEFAL
jgi:hypothetical protein